MTNTNITIRPANMEDMSSVSTIDAKITGEIKQSYWSDMFRRFGVRDDRYFLLAADAAGEIAGYIVGEIRVWEFGSPPCGWIFAVGVDPDVRVQKIGSRLFDAICQAFEANNIDTVRTMVARDDELIMSFFRSQGMMGGPFIELEMPLVERGAWVGNKA
jgi:ribosomal protein S18 acetylase RimI-like enzyme